MKWPRGSTSWRRSFWWKAILAYLVLMAILIGLNLAKRPTAVPARREVGSPRAADQKEPRKVAEPDEPARDYVAIEPGGGTDLGKLWEAERAKQQEPPKTIDPPAQPPTQGEQSDILLNQWRYELARCPKPPYILPNDPADVRARKRYCQGLWEKLTAVEETMEMFQGKRPWPAPRR